MKKPARYLSVIIFPVLLFASCARTPVVYSNGDDLVLPKWELNSVIHPDSNEIITTAAEKNESLQKEKVIEADVIAPQGVSSQNKTQHTTTLSKKAISKYLDSYADDEKPTSKHKRNYIFEEITDEPELDPFALVGFIAGLLGLFLFWPAIIAIIFSTMSIYRIKNEPEKYRGRGFAIAGLAMGITTIVAAGVLIYLLVTDGLI